MDKDNLHDSLKAALVELQEYLNLQIKYNKMLLAKKMGEVSSYLTLFLLVLGLSSFILLFLSFTFAEWFNDYYQTTYYGLLVVAGFYSLLALIIILFRRPLIYGPIRKMFGGILFGETEDSTEFTQAFKSTENLDNRIRKFRKTIEKKEEKLRKKFSSLDDQFTFSNIITSIAKNAYASFVTTTNIAKAAYNLVKRFSSKKKRVKRRSKNRPPELDEGMS